MKTVQKINIKANEILTLLILMILPFSFNKINTQWIVLFLILLGICVCIFIFNKIKPTSTDYGTLEFVFSLFYLLIFDVAENINIIKHIPVSTILVATGMITLMIKIVINGRIKLINHPFTLYFLIACILLLIMMVLFFPFFHHYYEMLPDSNILLFSKMIKYIMVILLINNYLTEEFKFKVLNLSMIMSLFVTIILSILL